MPLLQQLDAASFTTYAGRGVVDRAYPLHFGSLLARSGAKSVLGSADLVLVIGSELSEGDLWRAELGHKAPLIRVDLDPEVLTDSHQAELAISMRAEAFVPALLSQLQGHKAQTVWRAQEIQTQRRAWQRQVDLERPGILPICRALQAALPQDTMIFSDMTHFAILQKKFGRCRNRAIGIIRQDLELWDMRCPLLLEVRLAAPVCRGQRLSEITDFNIPCRNWALQLSSDYRFRLSYGTTPSCRKLKIV